MSAAFSYKTPLTMSFWKREGKLFYIEKDSFMRAVAECERTEEELLEALGPGREHLVKLLTGEGITYHSANVVDYFLTPVSELPTKSQLH